MRQGRSEKHEVIDRTRLSEPLKKVPYTAAEETCDLVGPDGRSDRVQTRLPHAIHVTVSPHAGSSCVWMGSGAGWHALFSAREESRAMADTAECRGMLNPSQGPSISAPETPGRQAESELRGWGTEMEFREPPSEG